MKTKKQIEEQIKIVKQHQITSKNIGDIRNVDFLQGVINQLNWVISK